MAGPKPGEPGRREYLDKLNERRRKRREDPEYVKRANARAVEQRARRKAKGKSK